MKEQTKKKDIRELACNINPFNLIMYTVSNNYYYELFFIGRYFSYLGEEDNFIHHLERHLMKYKLTEEQEVKIIEIYINLYQKEIPKCRAAIKFMTMYLLEKIYYKEYYSQLGHEIPDKDIIEFYFIHHVYYHYICVSNGVMFDDNVIYNVEFMTKLKPRIIFIKDLVGEYLENPNKEFKDIKEYVSFNSQDVDMILENFDGCEHEWSHKIFKDVYHHFIQK